MPLKFSANLSTMFQEHSFMERFKIAKDLGFEAVEFYSPYDRNPDEIKRALQGLKCDLINSPDYSSFGIASDPLKCEQFANSFQDVMPYYDSLGFKKIHILAGCKQDNLEYEDQLHTYTENLRSLVDSDFLDNRNLTAVIEPICSNVKNDYFLDNFNIAVDVIKEIKSDQIKLLLDIYHLHKITGNVKENLEKYYEYAGHIQVSQDPGRREPFHRDGKIDYNFVFNFLEQQNHQDMIGLEYIPSGKTEDSLDWLKKFK